MSCTDVASENQQHFPPSPSSGCDYEFMEYIDESSIDMNFICSICHKPLKDPVSTPCDHTYGRACITYWLTQSGKYSCPTCVKQPLLIKDLTPTSRLVINILDQLRVRCTLCEETGLQRGSFVHHVNKVCPKATVQCQAADIRCPWKGLRSELDGHVAVCVFELLRPVLATLIAENQKLTEQVRSHGNEIKKLNAKMSQLNNTTTARVDDGSDSDAPSVDDDTTQEEDAVFVRNLPVSVTTNEIFDLFSKIGIIKYNPTTKRPGIFIFRNSTQRTGFCSGKVIYTSREAVDAAIAKYSQQPIPKWNTKLLVSKFKQGPRLKGSGGAAKENVGASEDAEAAGGCETMYSGGERPQSLAEQTQPTTTRRNRRSHQGGKPTS